MPLSVWTICSVVSAPKWLPIQPTCGARANISSNYYKKAQFTLAAASPKQFPDDEGYEVAFVGRSNAGKSSAINVITEQNSLARTSKTPGRTQQIVFFTLDEQRRLVDLPGYGFAKVNIGVKKQWQQLIDTYLLERNSLRGCVLMMDCRHPMKEFDEMMIDWCQQSNMPLHILFTKSDKLKNQALAKALKDVKKVINPELVSVQAFSALKRSGVEEARARLDQWMDIATE